VFCFTVALVIGILKLITGDTMRSRSIIGLFTILLFVAPAIGQATLQAKQVAAPPSDILSGRLKLPDPIDLGVTSRTALLEARAEWAQDNQLGVGIPSNLGPDGGRVVFLAQEPDAWVGVVQALDDDRLVEYKTNQQRVSAGITHSRAALPWGDMVQQFDVVTLRAGSFKSMQMGIELKKQVDGFVLIDIDPDRELYSYVKQRRTLVDNPVTLVNSLSDGSKIVALRAVVRTPDGIRQEIDADINSDRISFTPTEPGEFAVRVIAEYSDQNNAPVILTTQHVIEVEAPAAPLGQARTRVSDDGVLFEFNRDESRRRVILAAEVWGRSGGAMVPVCWLSRVCDYNRSLSLDPRWIAMADVDPGTIELRQLRVHNVDSFVPLEIIDRLALNMPAIELPDAPATITPDMLQVLAPVAVDAPAGLGDSSQRAALPGGHRLLLVHGYCSPGNPFTASHFNGDIAQFSDPTVSRTHDAFALEILAQTAPMKSFGVAAHSQGAMASLHLYTYYFSGLDWARGERLIQSVGAPYQGTALAGNAAVLGDIFGFGCGENPDMNYTGSAIWLSLIPTSSREQVWYYTTSYEDRPFAFDYCNIITDLLLSDPDDGVIERDRGQLPGATNMGHLEGWCHTAGMRDPGQCTDLSRNTVINERARR